jgi:hypothetical protein
MNKHDVNTAVLAAQQNVEGALTIYELECLGYTVEALGHIPGLDSKFRWSNTHTREFQHFEVPSKSEAEAWARAAEAWGNKHDRKGLLSAPHCDGLTPAQLEGQYSHGGANGGGQHPVFTRADWRHAVGDGETVTGYWAWLASEIGQGKKRRAEHQGVREADRHQGWLGARH